MTGSVKKILSNCRGRDLKILPHEEGQEMKRTVEDVEEAEKTPEQVYETIRAAREERRAMLARYTETPIPLPPNEGIDEAFAEIEQRALREFAGTTESFELFLFTGHPYLVPRAGDLQCDWWSRILRWHTNEVYKRRDYIIRHGSRRDLVTFEEETLEVAYKYLRDVIENGWNTRQPKLPGSWGIGGMHFNVKYGE
jgi:hypothetical protein